MTSNTEAGYSPASSVHIFNPDTDYALAAGRSHYNPPASIRRLRSGMQLFPATFAHSGDFIVVDDDFDISSYPHPSHLAEAKAKNLKLITSDELGSLFLRATDPLPVIKPWGWNHSLRHLLKGAGVPDNALKSDDRIDVLRNLAHRRTTIPFIRELKSSVSFPCLELPCEFTSVESAMEMLRNHGDLYFKLPWSSAGRGVIRASEMTEEKLRQWLGGGIRRQGSVMGEVTYPRSADFATEWICSDGDVRFMGLSWFATTPDGRYMGNTLLSDNEILDLISRHTSHMDDKLIAAQKDAITSLIAPHYDGPLGIDMLATTEGDINPCVEINLRMTMGMATLLTRETNGLSRERNGLNS